jgi:two-component system, LuxR family, sensor kinase FixL
MSSASTTSESEAAEAAGSLDAPRLESWGRVLSLLDACLSDALCHGAPEKLSRCRLLVASNLFLVGCSLLFLAYVPVSPYPEALAWVSGGCLTGFLISMALLRWGRSSRLPSMLLCGGLTAGFLLFALYLREPRMGSHAIGLLIPVLAVYLVGPRQGFVFTALIALTVGLVLPLIGGLGWHYWVRNLFAALFILGGWALSWLLIAARDEAQAAMARTAHTLRESEGNLASLLENTEDVVCSLDAQGRLIAANSSLKRMMREYLGRQRPLMGQPLIDASAPEPLQARWRECHQRVMAGQRVRLEVSPSRTGALRVLDLSFNPVFGEGGRVVGMTLFGRDVTERKEAESKLGEMHRTLLDVSRHAGMAEMATGVLHNVGNALNSVNVSAGVLAERLRGSRVGSLARAAELLHEHAPHLASFLTEDPQGRQLPAYLQALAVQLVGEREAMLAEVRTLSNNLEHIKSVVSMQQAHARFAGLVELVEVSQLLDDALRLHAVSFERLGVEVRREYAEGPPVRMDRHKLLQILLNLLSNARHALMESGREDKRLIIRVERPGRRLRIALEDNGVGILPEIQSRLFTQGFTTKREGHGFGLHISALAAAEMGGSLTCSSEGRGRGATFTIDLPGAGVEPPAAGEEN